MKQEDQELMASRDPSTTASAKSIREAELRALLLRAEAATGPSEELDALILCAVAAPPGAYVEQSKINGAWCVYAGTTGRGTPRLWERTDGWHRREGWPLTTSLDAALGLVERVLPGWCGEIGWTADGRAAASLAPRPWQEHQGETVEDAGGSFGNASTRPLAICAALLKALSHQTQVQEG